MVNQKQNPASAEEVSTPKATPEAATAAGSTVEDPPAEKLPVERPEDEIHRLEADLEQALAEKAELLDRFQRAQAEFENTRKRLERETAEAKEYAAAEIIESLLPIVDDFERAVEAPGLDPEVRKGLELILQRMLDVFRRAGLEVIDDGGRFDPHLHQAVDRAPAESDEDDHKILETYRRGYRFKDRLLRAALVKVAVKE